MVGRLIHLHLLKLYNSICQELFVCRLTLFFFLTVDFGLLLFCQFGGKLITFENPKLPPAQSPQPLPRQVFVSQVTTETEFLQRSRELQAALQSGSFNNYCQAKIQNAKSDSEQDIWKFLLVGVSSC